MVKRFTDEEIVVILDLHWNNDDDEQMEMAQRADGALGDIVGDSLFFWDSVSEMFKDNEYVFYELYNEPHLTGSNANDIYLYGD